MLYHGLIILLIISVMPTNLIEGTLHPTNSMHAAMTCEDFGKTARFNPYSVLDEIWFVFYSWGKPLSRQFKFLFPTAKEKTYIKPRVENASIPVNWTAPMVLMKDVHTKMSTLLVQTGERGEFLMYPFQLRLQEGNKLKPVEIRLKQTCENTFIGYMNCKTDEVWAMSRIKQIPRKVRLQDAAATIGYRGRGGISYLYQGHHWMPIEETDENEFWLHPEMHRKRVAEMEQYAKDNPQNKKPDMTPKPSLFPDSIAPS